MAAARDDLVMTMWWCRTKASARDLSNNRTDPQGRSRLLSMARRGRERALGYKSGQRRPLRFAQRVRGVGTGIFGLGPEARAELRGGTGSGLRMLDLAPVIT